MRQRDQHRIPAADYPRKLRISDHCTESPAVQLPDQIFLKIQVQIPFPFQRRIKSDKAADPYHKLRPVLLKEFPKAVCKYLFVNDQDLLSAFSACIDIPGFCVFTNGISICGCPRSAEIRLR